MARATERFLNEIRLSHTVYSYVDVISPNQETKRLVAVGGEVNVDRTGTVRRAGRIECIDPLGIFVPDENSGILTPFGTEVRPYRGVRYTDGTTEVYPLGVFRLAKATFAESTSGAGVRITLELYDRSRAIARDKFVNTYTIPAASNLINAIKLIVGRTYPDAEYDSISTTITTTSPKVFNTADDPWQAATDMATSCGCEIYFDTTGRVVIAPPTDIDALPAPDFSYIENRRNTLVDLKKEYADEPGFNGVVVSAQSSGDELPPVRAEAWDTEPTSPTYYLGPYGRVPTFVNDTNVKTVADAQAMADSLLKGQIGFSSKLSVSSWVNPVLEAGDVIQVERQKMGVTGLYTVDAFNIPLRKEGIQNLTLRTRRTVA